MRLARDLGMTRAELLTGTPQPLDGRELALWAAFYTEEARQAARAYKAAAKASGGETELDDLP